MENNRKLLKRIPYNRDYDLVVPEYIAVLDNPKKYLLANNVDIEEYLSPKRAKSGFSSKSGPKGSRKGYYT